MRVTKTEFIFPAKGGERSAPHGYPIPDQAESVTWDADAMALTYVMSDEDGESTSYIISVTQDKVDEVEAASYLPSYDVASLIANLWNDFNDYALGQTDLNARSSISLVLDNPHSTPQQVQRVTDWGNWWAAHWLLYGQKRAEIEATSAPVGYTFTPAPWTIWEITA